MNSIEQLEQRALKAIFTKEQRSYFDKLIARAKEIAKGRTREQMVEDRDLAGLREVRKLQQALIVFLQTKEVPKPETAMYGKFELRKEEVEFFQDLEQAIFDSLDKEEQTEEEREKITNDVEAMIKKVEDCSCVELNAREKLRKIKTLPNISRLTNLRELHCSSNEIHELEVQGLTNLQELYCGNNELPELEVQGLTNLQVLSCFGNKLTQLEVQGLTNLQELKCGRNKLTQLEVQGLTNLQKLHCYDNELTHLDAQELTNLQELDCGVNKLTHLEVQGLTNLRELYCGDNKLTHLEVQGLTNLRYLRCSRNKLTDLDVEGLTNLRELRCSGNKLPDQQKEQIREYCKKINAILDI